MVPFANEHFYPRFLFLILLKIVFFSSFFLFFSFFEKRFYRPLDVTDMDSSEVISWLKREINDFKKYSSAISALAGINGNELVDMDVTELENLGVNKALSGRIVALVNKLS